MSTTYFQEIAMAYLTQERIQHQQDALYQASVERDAWIDKRANELLVEYPAEPFNLASRTLSKNVTMSFFGSKAKAAYEDFIHALAWAQAEKEWEDQYGWAA